MDILLTHGYFLEEDLHEKEIMKPYPPLGLLYISSYLKSKGVQVKVLDNTFQNWNTFNQDLESLMPPVVGIYCNMMTRGNVLKIIKKCKEIKAYVILGGPEPVNYPEEYLQKGADIICAGEGELTLEELLQDQNLYNLEKLRMIKGIIFQDQEGNLIKNEARPQIKDLDQQPFPDRGALDLQKYIQIWRQYHGKGPVSLITARGCAYSCSWCSHSVFGHTNRRRSPENVVEEIKLIIQQYNPDTLWFADDVFTLHHRWLKKFNDLVKLHHIRLPFETISREDRLNEEIIKVLAELGCWRLWVGAESGSQKILDKMSRRTNAKRVCELVPLLQKYGIQVGLFIMLGYEGEEMEDLKETVQFIKRANPDIFVTTEAYPIKGTVYYQEVENKIIPLQSWDNGSDRKLKLRNSHTSEFYQYANRWLHSEVALHKQRINQEKDYFKMVKTFVKIHLGRLGMKRTINEKIARSQSS